MPPKSGHVMAHAVPHVSLDSSRLIRFLTDLSLPEAQVSHQRFSEKLGKLINFADAITLAEAHTQAPELEDEGIGEFRFTAQPGNTGSCHQSWKHARLRRYSKIADH